MLTEAAVCERLRRVEEIALHPSLFNTPLIYDGQGRTIMQEIYGQYRNIALNAGVPVLLSAPTWRVDRERITRAKVPRTINRDAVKFMLELRDQWDLLQAPVHGCRIGRPEKRLLPAVPGVVGKRGAFVSRMASPGAGRSRSRPAAGPDHARPAGSPGAGQGHGRDRPAVYHQLCHQS